MTSSSLFSLIFFFFSFSFFSFLFFFFSYNPLSLQVVEIDVVTHIHTHTHRVFARLFLLELFVAVVVFEFHSVNSPFLPVVVVVVVRQDPMESKHQSKRR